MPATKLGVYELLAPQFLAGFTFPPHVDRYLAFVSVDELRTAFDDTGIVYTGRVSFGGDGEAAPRREHRDPGGGVFRWDDVFVDFRLTIPRDGAAFINTAATGLIPVLPEFDRLFNDLGVVEQATGTATEYPGVRFRLELMLSALVFHLPTDTWVPGEVGPDFKIRPSTDPADAGQDVKFVLPKAVLIYEQGDDLSLPPEFKLASWGSGGFDAPHDLAQGELIRMDPPIALHESGRFAFGVGQILIDLSEDSTPPEILEFFGTDEAFQGLFVRSARIFYLDEGKDFGFNIGVNDLLISFRGEISMEAFVHIFANTPITVFDVEVKFFIGKTEVDYTKGKKERNDRTITITGSRARVTQTAIAQLDLRGGVPRYSISVTIDGQQVWNDERRDARISPGMPDTLLPVGEHDMVVHVVDEASPGGHHEFTQQIRLEVVAAETDTPVDPDGSELDREPVEGARQDAVLTVDPTTPLPPGGNLRLLPGSSSDTETLFIEGGENPHIVIRNGASVLTDRVLGQSRSVAVLCPHGATLDIEIEYPGTTSATPEVFELFFDYDKPKKSQWDGVLTKYKNDTVDDARFRASVPPSGGPASPSGGAANLKKWIQDRLSPPRNVHIEARASAEGESDYNKKLSERRLDVAKAIATAAGATVDPASEGTGEASANQSASTEAERNLDRVAIVTGSVGATSPSRTVRATLSRPPRPQPDPPQGDGDDPKPVIKPTDPAPEIPTRRPPYLRRLSFRIRLERNLWVLLELSGEVDFETEFEEGLRNNGVDTGSLAFKQLPAAVEGNDNPADGVVEFKLLITHDRTIRQVSETLYLGASPQDKDGLLRMTVEPTDDLNSRRIRNIGGALLTLAPVLNSAAAAVDPHSAGDWALLAISLGVPIAIGGLEVESGVFIFQTRSITLFGGEGRFRQFLPADEEPVRFTDFGVIFDYGVEFGIEIPQLKLKTERNLKVRYKAVGFNLHFEDGVTYQPIFDTSRGYEIDLGDPGLFNIGEPLGSLIKVFGVRLARFNPLTLELDLGLKVDLGVITVDRFKVKWPLDPLGAPSILPSGVKVRIPATLEGEGRVQIVDQEVNGVAQKGILGSLDVTVVPTKLRIAASLGLLAIEDIDTRRKAIAVFAGLIVEFPTPILLWSTGLGLYGFSGLFAMHFKRDEPAAIPGDSIPPSLKWLVKAEGEPAKLFNGSGQALWVPEFDKWAFGLGLILGTVEGGFLVNFRGMFVLELPGPRILIFVKVQVIEVLPKLPDQGLTTGILGVIDLDFNQGQLTIGVLIDMKIEKIVEIKIPIEIFFKFNNLRNWHLYVGTISAPASARVLNLVQARGYFMIDGNQIAPFPPAIAGQPAGPGLPGIAVAVGIDASVIFGDTSVGLYLKVSAGAHLGVSFGSKLFVTGLIYLEGELRLFIVSIGATGTLTVAAPNPTLIDGEVCGKVSFFFFSVKGCVGVHIGSGSHSLPAPDLINGVFLQSHAPVIAAGQGGERPIDGSLGNAIDAATNPADADLPQVPIDSLPVLQFFCAPRVSDGSSSTTTFTRPLTPAPNLTPNGWVSLGGDRRVRYFLREISLDQGFLVPAGAADPKPPATWRRDVPPGAQGANTSVDLALFSNVPIHGERALERSTELNSSVKLRWENLCQKIAPPACVLWTFCGQPFGPSGEGWLLHGTAQPDPPGTVRATPPPTKLQVNEPALSELEQQLNLLGAATHGQFEDAARVIGRVPVANQRDRQICAVFSNRRPAVLGRRFFDSGMTFVGAAELRVTTIRGRTGLGFRNTISIRLPEPASLVLAEVINLRSDGVVGFVPIRMEALRGRRTVGVDQQLLLSRTADILQIRADAIDSVTISGPETLLLRFCYLPASSEPKLDPQCFRALQLPQFLSTEEQPDLNLTSRVRDFLNARAARRWIELETGAANQVLLYVSLPQKFRDRVFAVQLAQDDSVVEEQSVTALGPAVITGITTNLPSDWLADPWQAEVLPVATLMAELDAEKRERLLLTIKPSEKMQKLRLEVRGPKGSDLRVILGVVEVCSREEAERAEHEEEVRTGDVQTVSGYLNDGAPVPLLMPGRRYTLTARYDAEIEGETAASRTQRFVFKTDEAPPDRLDSRVLATTPNTDEQFHFCDDPVKIVFNDLATIPLYQAYGRSLRIRLRAADGVPMPDDELTTLDPVQSAISTPYREALEALIAGGLLPCTGEIDLHSHGSHTVPIPLRPLMAYTLDIETDPSDPATGAATVPLFRRQFRTGRFASPAALVADLRERHIRHRALTGPILNLPSGTPLTPGGTPVGTATDIELLNAMSAAGEEPMPAPSISGITIYWIPNATGTGFSPHAVLLDAAEPLWRTRFEPVLETVPLQAPPNDPAFQRVVLKDVPAMEVTASPANIVQRFVKSAGGTRTLCFLNPGLSVPDSGLPLRLSVHRPASLLFSLPNEVTTIVDLVLKSAAPWEDDHE
ncbi:MAG: hypothetical protein R3C19_19450 [Planctomycetaceae bacterium]